MVKRTDTTGDWQVYHRSLANTEYLVLNTTAAKATGATRWNSTTPTSTVFSIGTDATVNASGGTYVAYLFAHDAGGFGLTGTDNVISCGSFTTDGSGNATVNLGYEPQWIMTKATTEVSDWYLADVMRGTSNTNFNRLNANTSGAETSSSVRFIPTATGFTASGLSTATFIYIAIRRGPMKVPTTGTSVFGALTRTGTGANATISGLSFPVDMLIGSTRDSARAHAITDRLRGAKTALVTNSTAADTADATGVTGLDRMDGFTLGTDVSYTGTFNGGTSESKLVHYFRRAPSFFDEVCYTGNGVAGRTVTHNLGVAPELIITKNRDNTNGWFVYSATLGNTKYLKLELTDASATDAFAWNNTSPTSTVFTVGDGGGVNGSGVTQVAYLFATCAGVSKVGSYTGTGTTLQIDCSFTAGARFVLIKRTSSTGGWYVWDSARGIIAGNDPYLFLNSTAAEVTSTDYVDTYSAGFEISSTAPAAINGSGGTFIFLAIA
jgi:hypothetical protein